MDDKYDPTSFTRGDAIYKEDKLMGAVINSALSGKDTVTSLYQLMINYNIELLAIGIGHDVTRYYSKAIKIADVQDLGDVMINQLTDLFVEKNKKKKLH